MNWNLETDHFLIRLPVSDEDSESLFGLLKNASSGAHLPRTQLFASVQTLDELRRAAMQFQAREAATWLVERLTGSFEERAALAARIRLSAINWIQSSGRLEWELDDALEASQLAEIHAAIESFVFDELGLHRLEVRMLPQAQRHTDLAVMLGYQYEGTLPAQLEFDGEWVDQAVYGRLSSDRDSQPE